MRRWRAAQDNAEQALIAQHGPNYTVESLYATIDTIACPPARVRSPAQEACGAEDLTGHGPLGLLASCLTPS